MHLYFENPPQEQSDRWSGRPFRAMSVIHPPAPINLDPTRTEADKTRFLENLWNAQATYRTKAGQSVALCGEEREVEGRGGRITIARTYFNIYQRTAFLQESKKVRFVNLVTFSHQLIVSADENCRPYRFAGLCRSHTIWRKQLTTCMCSSSAYGRRAFSLQGHV